MLDQSKVPATNPALQIPRTTLPLLPGSSSLSVNHASYLLASQGYYGTNGASAGMYLGHGMMPPTLLYPQLYQQSHLQTSIHLLGSDSTRSSYDASAASAAQHQESHQSNAQSPQELLNKELHSPRICTDDSRHDTNGHTTLSPRERLGSLRLNASRTAQNEVTTVWRPYWSLYKDIVLCNILKTRWIIYTKQSFLLKTATPSPCKSLNKLSSFAKLPFQWRAYYINAH